MILIKPSMVNFRERVSLTFQGSTVRYSAIADDQRICYGRVRRLITFLITGDDYRKRLNEIEHSNDYFLVFMPFYPVRMKTLDDTDLNGETDLVVDGNIFRRPMTLWSNFESLYPDNVTGKGVGPIAVFDWNAENYQINQILKAGSYDSGTFGPVGEPFNTSLVRLSSAINFSIKAKNLVLLDFMYAQYLPGNAASDISGRVGEGLVTFEEIFEGEKW